MLNYASNDRVPMHGLVCIGIDHVSVLYRGRTRYRTLVLWRRQSMDVAPWIRVGVFGGSWRCLAERHGPAIYPSRALLRLEKQ